MGQGIENDSPSVQKNTVFNTIRTISSIIYPLITFPYISRVLGAENVGKVNFSSSFVSYFSLITTLGITSYAIRECSLVKDDKKELEKTSSQIYSINICMAVVAYVVLILCTLFVPKLSGYKTLILIQSLGIILTVIGTDWLNTAMEDFRYITIRTAVFQILALICMFAFVRSREHYKAYAVTAIIASSGAYIANVFYRKKYCHVRFTTHMDWKRHTGPIVTMVTMIMAQHILNNLDITMIGVIKDDTAVGLYTTAAYLINFVTQLANAIIFVIMPQMTKAFDNNDNEQLNSLYRYTVSFMLAVALPCFAGLLVMPEEILTLIGGAEYLPSAGVVRILSFSMLFMLVGSFFGNIILIPAKREKQFMRACMSGMVINAITNCILIPPLGIHGAAITTVAANIVIMVISMIGKPAEIRLSNVGKIITGPILGTIFVFIICIVFKVLIDNAIIRLLIAIAISGIAYLVTLIAVKDEFAQSTIIPAFRKVLKIGK
ncbi:flippase [Butyrivibrio fibrisolvens]|uniref:Uncharacterized protein n=1 Tax=Butyrivibrio fibrisolvens TaxID=831 RepID=A0A317FYA8_BUTFI|nr:flippase [Butyrivibrio fibrisolvens]PWT26207.1 hypothetical protein CPT75_03265 [Butyrivibrio fibrisolvens]